MATDFAAIARLLASPARSAVVSALLENRPLAAGELARVADVGASTISEHLNELVNGGLLTVMSSGRHRYYQLASADIAEALEAFAWICPTTPVRSLRQSTADRSFRLARLCYDHVAGALGVALLDQMFSAGWLDGKPDVMPAKDYDVTRLGGQSFMSLGIDVDSCLRARRHFARPCLDWSQRRPHLAGALGAALASALLDRGWLRRGGTGRGVAVTEAGANGIWAAFGIDMRQLEIEMLGVGPAQPRR